jgi:hypothetical protein
MSKSIVLALLVSVLFTQSNAFAPTLPFTKYAAATANSARVAPLDRVVATGIQHAAPASPIALHMIDPVQSSLLVAAAEPWVQPTINVLDPFLNLFSFFMVRKTLLYFIQVDLQLHYTYISLLDVFDVLVLTLLLC